MKAVILSLSKLNIESKNFCYKSCSMHCFLRIGCKKGITVICHFLYQIKTSFNKSYIWYLLYDVCYLLLAIYDLLYVTCYLWLDTWIFLSETCYYLQKLVPFAARWHWPFRDSPRSRGMPLFHSIFFTMN